MKKKITLIVLLLLAIISNKHVVMAEKIKKDEIVENFTKFGYRDFDEALGDFEQAYERKVSLPKKYPFKVTYKFGKIDNEGKLDLYYYNHTSKQIFKIFISSDINYYDEIKGREVVLADSTKAYIRKGHDLLRIHFVKNRLAYSVSINHIRSPKITEKDLIHIANSI
ncbi:hypothetical protein [Peribacillus acanthi]|uniref:hypothetical protein n=1 Tax=Peribacillus acanthi TaxID=2171554 RepID=UPI000D3ED3D3|nr:hypothetical protein [Peribacillus acanthi]